MIGTLGINIDFNVIWPTFLILLGIAMMIENKKIDVIPGCIVFIGIWYLLSSLGVIPKNIADLWWPILLILIGVIIVGKNINKK